MSIRLATPPSPWKPTLNEVKRISCFRNICFYLLALGQYPITSSIYYAPSHPAKDGTEHSTIKTTYPWRHMVQDHIDLLSCRQPQGRTSPTAPSIPLSKPGLLHPLGYPWLVGCSHLPIPELRYQQVTYVGPRYPTPTFSKGITLCLQHVLQCGFAIYLKPNIHLKISQTGNPGCRPDDSPF